MGRVRSIRRLPEGAKRESEDRSRPTEPWTMRLRRRRLSELLGPSRGLGVGVGEDLETSGSLKEVSGSRYSRHGAR